MAEVETVHPDCRWEDIHRNGTVCDVPALDFFSLEEALPAHVAIISFSVIFLVLHKLYYHTSHATLGAVPQSVQDWFEYLFIQPFVPLRLESFVAYLASGWFLGTVTMAITRFYHKQWAVELLSQQGPFNLVSWLLGGGMISPTAHVYTYENTNQVPEGNRGFVFLIQRSLGKLKNKTKAGDFELDEQDPESESQHFKNLDLFFSLHLFCGLLWLTVGGLQIFWAKAWSIDTHHNRRAHKIFGYFVALPALALHLIDGFYMAYMNPVNQDWTIQFLYFGMVINATQQVVVAMQHAHPETRRFHKYRMVKLYILTIFGSGAIRFAAWILWLVGKFLPFGIRVLIDRGTCQSNSKIFGNERGFQADAELCYAPVFMNLASTQVLQTWLQYILACLLTRDQEFDHIEKRALYVKIKALIFILGVLWTTTIILDVNDVVPHESERTMWRFIIIFYVLFIEMEITHYEIARSTADTTPEGDTTFRRTAVALFGDLHDPQRPHHPHQD